MITGCAFLTYFSPESALNAQNALHEKHTLPGVSSPRSLPDPFIPFHCSAPLFSPLQGSSVSYYREFYALILDNQRLDFPGFRLRTAGRRDRRVRKSRTWKPAVKVPTWAMSASFILVAPKKKRKMEENDK